MIVIGASAGGVEALLTLARSLPPDIDATVLVALHMGPTARTVLPQLLGRAGSLPALLAEDGQQMGKGQILVASPDHHLLVEDGVVRLNHGPRVGGQRPSVDELFRSAAAAAGPRTIAVVLSGTLDDGSAGAVAVQRAGGHVMVQDPADAAFPDMPANAMKRVKVDDVVPARELGALLARLSSEPVDGESARMRQGTMSIEPISDEGAGALPPSGYTCPECHGALWPLLEDQTALRCRVGHTWGPESLAEAQTTQVEAALWAAMRALEEQAELVKTLAQRAEDRGDSRTAARFHQRWEAAHVQARVIGDLVRQGVAPPAAVADG